METSCLPDVPDDLKCITEYNSGIGLHDGLCRSVYGLRAIFSEALRCLQRIKDDLLEWMAFYNGLTHGSPVAIKVGPVVNARNRTKGMVLAHPSWPGLVSRDGSSQSPQILMGIAAFYAAREPAKSMPNGGRRTSNNVLGSEEAIVHRSSFPRYQTKPPQSDRLRRLEAVSANPPNSKYIFSCVRAVGCQLGL